MTVRTRGLIWAVVIQMAAVVAAQVPPPATTQSVRPPETVWREVSLVDRFDRDGDGRLNDAERQAAKAYLAAHPELRDAGRRGRITGPGEPGLVMAPGGVPRVSAKVPLFHADTIRTLFLEFDLPDWERELAAFWHTDVDLPAQMSVDGVSYPGVGVHIRGHNSFLGVAEGRKRPLTISMDFVDAKQRLLGYRGLHLINGYQDPTFLRGVLFLHIARQYLPAPQSSFVRVVINGESWGLYVNKQRFDTDFLRDAFKTTAGTRWRSLNNAPGGGLRYLGDDPAPYREAYEIKSQDLSEAWTSLIRLCKTLDETAPGRLSSALAPLLDVEGALKFLALDNALQNGDGYFEDGSDYSLYLDEKGRFHLVHYDVNEALLPIGGGRATGPNRGAALDPFARSEDPNKALLHKLLAAPDLRARYLRYLRDIAERWLDWGRLGPIVDRYEKLIASDVERDTRKLYSLEQFKTGIAGEVGGPAPLSSLKGFADARRAFLLAHPEIVRVGAR